MHRLVVISGLYNVEPWIERTVMSVARQDYGWGWDWYAVDDCSTDGTVAKFEETVANLPHSRDRFHLIKNKKRKGALYNWVHAIDKAKCKDEDIILLLGGDDWLSGRKVFNAVADHYIFGNHPDANKVWMTHGSYIEYPSMKNGDFNRPYPDDVRKNGTYRFAPWSLGHLITFKYGLFKNVNREDLLVNGEWPMMTGDLFLFFPMLEMACERVSHMKSKVYVYNLETPLNDHKVNHELQLALEREARSRKPYERLCCWNDNSKR